MDGRDCMKEYVKWMWEWVTILQISWKIKLRIWAVYNWIALYFQ